MDAADIELRNATYRRFVELGRAPTAQEIAEDTTRSEGDVRDAWRRLHDAHALVLDEADNIRMANPFSAVPTPFRVRAAGKEWYANCGWDSFGITAPFWFGFIGSAVLVAVLWREFTHIAHEGAEATS